MRVSARTVDLIELGNSGQIELNHFDDALKVLNDNMNNLISEALLFLKDILEELNLSQLQDLLAAFNNYLENNEASNQILSTILDLLITIFSEEDLESFNLIEIVRNVL